MTVKNQHIANAIAALLAEGRINHPGNTETKQPAVVLALPMFATRGRDPKMAQAMHDNLQVIAEAIVHHIETDMHQTIIATTELDALRAQTNGAPNE